MKTITLRVTRDGHYNEVELQLPAASGEIDAFYRRLDQISTDTSSTRINDVYSSVEYLGRYIQQFIHVDKRPDLAMLNTLARAVSGMDEGARYKLSCTLNPMLIKSFHDVLRLQETQDDYELFPDIGDDAEFGRYLVDNSMIIFPEQVKPYLDYALIGVRFSSRYGGGLGPRFAGSFKRGYAAPKKVLETLQNSPIQIMDNRRMEDAFLEEACRQWYAFILEDNDRMDGAGFADFYREIREQLIDDPDFMENFKAQGQSAPQMGGISLE